MKDILDNNIFPSEGNTNSQDDKQETFDKTLNPSFEFEIEHTTPKIKELIKDNANQQLELYE